MATGKTAFNMPKTAAAPVKVVNPYRFIKVEEFFDNYRESWNKLEEVISHEYNHALRTLILEFQQGDKDTCAMLIQFMKKDIFRVRFHPANSSLKGYTNKNTRTVVMDSLSELQHTIEEMTDEPLNIIYSEDEYNNTVTITTEDKDGQEFIKVTINKDPFMIKVLKCDINREIWRTDSPGIYYKENGYTKDGNIDYSIIQVVHKPATAKYVGFGEQGGRNLEKNMTRLNYFNFDNMRYNQVYGDGPFEEREPLYHSDLLFMEFNGIADLDISSVYGINVDNTSQVCMDLGYENSTRYVFGTRFGELDYYFMHGKNCEEVLYNYTLLIGRAKLKPRYILGYHQGCYGYDSRKKVEETVENYNNFQIPIDGMHIDIDIQKNYKTFTIDANQDKFPEPDKMFAGLKARGIKCSTNITPIISNNDPDNDYETYREGFEKGYFIKDKRIDANAPGARWYQCYGGGNEYFMEYRGPDFNSGNPYIGEVNYGGDRGTTGHYPDFGSKDIRIWWGRQYQYLFDTGLEMVWQDMTTPAIRNTRGDMKGFPFRLLLTDNSISDTDPDKVPKIPAINIWNLYSYNLHKATYKGLNALKGRENKRNFIIGRGCYAGMHRYAGLWTGDNCSSWDFLKINISQVLAMGMCGQAIVGQDIGGFEPSYNGEGWADPELLIRWTAVGAFLPWFRNHYTAKGSKKFQEPYNYQYVNLNTIPEDHRYLYESVLPTCKYYIELRYRLLQLFYDAMFENMENGMPICRAMFVNDSNDRALYNDKLSYTDSQFFVRKDLLVAPVLEKQTNANNGRRKIYLPAWSNWYAFMDNKKPLLPKIEGGATIRDYDARIDTNSDHIGFIVPIYVRAGAIIPTIELEQYVGERNEKGFPNPITLNIYPGESGEYTMYLDDGISRSSAPRDAKKFPQFADDKQANSEYRKTLIKHQYTNKKTREITIERVFDNYTPKLEKYFFVAILHDPAENIVDIKVPLSKVNINKNDIKPISGGNPEHRADELNVSENSAWYYNENVNISFIKVFDNDSSIKITLAYN